MALDTPRLKAHFGYGKFTSPPYRILFLSYDFFLQNSLINELQRRGHEVVTLPFPKDIAVEEALRTLLKKAAEVRPDAIMTLNGLGFDNHGRTISVLSELTLPVVIWYLDNHLFTGPYFKERSPDWAIAFTYERSLESSLREAGFQHVFYLPLATDLSLAKMGATADPGFLKDKVTYVGATFSTAVDEFHTPEFEQIYHSWRPNFGAQKAEQGRVDLDSLFAPHRDRFSSMEDFYRFMAYVIACETRRYRADRLSGLVDESLIVFGPAEWKDYLPEQIVKPPVDYQTETPLVYRNSAVNLSLATFQQETALNQRYYDVPLCGGFLLGEWQESLAEHFSLEEEVVYFRNDEELKDKVRYYLKHPGERQQIVKRARERILHEHLMEHRVTTMLDLIRRICA